MRRANERHQKEATYFDHMRRHNVVIETTESRKWPSPCLYVFWTFVASKHSFIDQWELGGGCGQYHAGRHHCSSFDPGSHVIVG